MRSTLDRRVIPEHVIGLVRACQRVSPARLGGGVALSAGLLSHRLSNDIDLVCGSSSEVRDLVRELPDVALSVHAEVRLVRDAGSFVRAAVTTPQGAIDVDVIVEGVGRINPECPVIDDVVLEPLEDLRASKLTCVLSRSEPRDLVDLLFLERAGYPVEDDLDNALKKDAGIDPGVLAWLLRQYPIEPLPQMLQPLSSDELRSFRDDLAARLARLAVPR